MNLMDCMMDEFQDEAKIKNMDEKDICSWLEVCVHTTAANAAICYWSNIKHSNIWNK